MSPVGGTAGRRRVTRTRPIAKRKHKVDPPALESDFCAGKLPIPSIAKKHGISVSSVYRRAKQHGWRRLPERCESNNRREVPEQRTVGELGPLLRELASKLRARLDRIIGGKSVDGLVLAERESPASLLLKLCQINEKIIALQRRLAGEPSATTPLELDAQDRRIIDRFKRQYGLERP